MTSAVPIIARKAVSPHRDIASFLAAIARPKPQDQNAGMAYGYALALDQNCAEAWNGLGRVAAGQGHLDSAVDAFTRAIELNPQSAEAHIHRAVALDRIGFEGMAIEDLEKALAIDPSITTAELLLFGILENAERTDEARKLLDRAIAKRPDDPDLLFCRASMELAAGDFRNGWRDYEARPTKIQLNQLLDEYPEWDGSPLEGKRILVCREQGLGDEIMFARFIPEVAQRGGHVIVYAYPALARLFQTIPGVAEVVTWDKDIPEFDCWVGMGSLPLKLGATLKLGAALKARTYLGHSIPLARCMNAVYRVGLCWQGNPQHARDSFRSIPFEALKPLLSLPNIEFVSLQQFDEVSGLERTGERCHDLYSLAEEIASLDLVITVDTSTAHLAGSMGIPTWVLLGKPADWRWNTPLYHSVRLFRNERPKLWKPLIAQVGKELAKLAPAESFDFSAADKHVREITETSVAVTRYGDLQYFTHDQWLGRSFALYGEWSEGECDLYRQLLGPDDVVVEVGANIGAHTVPMAKLAKWVIALEPNTKAMRLLIDNTRTFPNVFRHCRAAGSIDGYGTVTEPVNNPGGAVIAANEHGAIPITTLDVLLATDQPTFLKLDCEGSELDVLRGAEKTIERCRPLLYVENDRAEKAQALVEWIHAHGYRMYQHYIPLYSPDNFAGYKLNVFGNTVSAMLLCVPNERKDVRPAEWGLERVRVTRR